MMRPYGSYEPGEEDLPEGWEADLADQDPAFAGITDLLKQADDPHMPAPAAMEGMRHDLRNQLLREGLLNHPEPDAAAATATGRPRDMGFGEWLRVLLTGGGIPAQALRFGLVAGGFVFFMPSNTPEPTAAPEAGPAALASAPAPKTAESTASAAQELAAADEEEGASSALPVMLPPETEMAIAKSIHNSPQWQFPGGQASGRSMAVPVSARSGNTPPGAMTAETAQAHFLAAQALDQLQLLKFSSLLNKDDRGMEQLRRLEKTLTDLMGRMEGQSLPETAALKHYQRAELFLKAGRVDEGVNELNAVIDAQPGSSLAFLAQFQVGRLALEHLKDYPLALQSFRACLNQYPTLEITAAGRQALHDQVQLLEEMEAERWMSLRIWQSVDQARTPRDAANALMMVLRESTSAELAADAGLRLKELIVADRLRNELDPAAALTALRQRLSQSAPTPEAARLQFALGEILARRLEKSDAAAAEYQKALELNPDPATRQAAEMRLATLGK